MPRSGISGSYDTSIFTFLSASILFSIVAVSIYIPTNSVGSWFLFPYTLPSIDLTHIYGIYKNGTDETISRAEIEVET